MAEYRRGAHTVFEIQLHIVWITKYRRPALKGEVATRSRDLIRDICGQHDVRIIKGHVSKDPIHLFVSIPPQVTASRLVQWLNGKTAHHLMAKFAHARKQSWGRHLWARGYFCRSFGNIADEMVAAYIANQNTGEDEDSDFKRVFDLSGANKKAVQNGVEHHIRVVCAGQLEGESKADAGYRRACSGVI